MFGLMYSLKYKFLLSTLLLVIVLSLSISYLWMYRMSKNEENSISASVSEMLRISNENFDFALRDINYTVSLASVNTDIIEILGDREGISSEQYLKNQKIINNYASSASAFKKYLGSLLISDLDGYYSNTGIHVSITDIKKLPEYKQVLQSKGNTVIIPRHNYDGSPARSDYSNMYISLARPILDNGVVAGVIVADVKSEILLNLFKINLKNNGTVFILDRKSNKVIFNTEDNQLGINLSVMDIESVTKNFKARSGSFYSTLEGKDFLLVYNFSAFTDWATVAFIPKDKLFENYRDVLQMTLILSMIFVLASAAISYFIAHYMTRNLRVLTRTMIKIDKDNLDVPILNISSRDEIAQLSRQFNLMLTRIVRLITDTKIKEKEKRNAEMKALQAQINPHFLHNTLNTIKFLADLQGSENIKEVSESLSRLMHLNMDSRTFIRIDEEMEALKSYLKIQEYRYSGIFTSQIEVEEEIGETMILKLLLQPFVENALKHGIHPKKEMGHLSVKAYRDGSVLKIKIQDNGIGMPETIIDRILDGQRKLPHNSIGIRNVVTRIDTMFGESYGVSIVSESNLYTLVEITLPLLCEKELEQYD